MADTDAPSVGTQSCEKVQPSNIKSNQVTSNQIKENKVNEIKEIKHKY